MLLTIGDCKYCLFFVWIVIRAYESEALLLFVFFQKHLRLGDLQVARDQFRQMERKMQSTYLTLSTLILIPYLIQCVAQFFIPEDLVSKLNCTYFFGLWTLGFATFTNSGLKLLLQIHRDHRMAYHSHKWSLLGLYLATEIGLIAIMLFQVKFVILGFCGYGDEQAMLGPGICSTMI